MPPPPLDRRDSAVAPTATERYDAEVAALKALNAPPTAVEMPPPFLSGNAAEWHPSKTRASCLSAGLLVEITGKGMQVLKPTTESGEADFQPVGNVWSTLRK